MALTSTILRFQVELADIDRNKYETMSFQVPQHPSESADRVVVRLLAYLMLFEDNIAFGRGLSTPEDPAVHITDLSGQLLLWIEVGAPSAERLHRSNKRTKRLEVFSHKYANNLAREWKKSAVHEQEKIRITLFDTKTIAAIAETLSRQNEWVLTIHEGLLQLAAAGENYQIEPSCYEGLNAFFESQNETTR